MGRMKELMIDKQNDLESKVEELTDNTKDLKEMSFDEDIDVSKIKEIVNETLRVLKELKEIILL